MLEDVKTGDKYMENVVRAFLERRYGEFVYDIRCILSTMKDPPWDNWAGIDDAARRSLQRDIEELRAIGEYLNISFEKEYEKIAGSFYIEKLKAFLENREMNPKEYS